MRILPGLSFAFAAAFSLSLTSCAQEKSQEEAQNETQDIQERQGTTLAFGSCAGINEVTERTWAAILAAQPDIMIALGDTPYIDTTNSTRQRERYEEFAQAPGFIAVTEVMHFYGIWDDHDFGRNDTDGNLEGKENSRAAFIAHYENFGNTSFGNGEEGVYSSFVEDNIEVFLLDTRYFAATEPSSFDADKPTLLGQDQWEWLREAMLESEADFKVLACGMIWNGSVRPGKTDHWGAYPHEYDALMQFIGDNHITGVILIGGDIHRSRCVLHDTKDSAGYDIPEFITSPMHDRIIEAANQPHPGLKFDTGTPSSYLLLNVTTDGDGNLITARFMAAGDDKDAGEELFVFSTTDSELSAAP